MVGGRSERGVVKVEAAKKGRDSQEEVEAEVAKAGVDARLQVEDDVRLFVVGALVEMDKEDGLGWSVASSRQEDEGSSGRVGEE